MNKHVNKYENQAIETLRTNDREKEQLLWAINRSSQREVPPTGRRLRVSCAHRDAIMTLHNDTGTTADFATLARNISRYGVSLIHGRYVYPVMRCEVQLCALNGTWHACAGEVRHSRHVQGFVHELGVLFDKPIDLSEFSLLSPSEETAHLQELADDLPESDNDQVTQVASRVLVVDDYASDRKLYSHWLNGAGMLVSTVGDIDSARERAEESQFDLAVIDLRLGNESGVDLIRTLRQTQFVAPILAVSADETTVAKDSAVKAGANRYLCKPFTGEELVATANELMGVNNEKHSTPIYSTMNNDPAMRPLLTEFTRGLPRNMEQLREANARHDYESLDQIARSFKGTGSGYGFEAISEQATEVLLALNADDADLEKIKQSANELLCILNRVKIRVSE